MSRARLDSSRLGAARLSAQLGSALSSARLGSRLCSESMGDNGGSMCDPLAQLNQAEPSRAEPSRARGRDMAYPYGRRLDVWGRRMFPVMCHSCLGETYGEDSGVLGQP